MQQKRKTTKKRTKLKNVRTGSYGGYGGSSPSKTTGAINEFEDNLNVDWDDKPGRTEKSVTGRVKPLKRKKKKPAVKRTPGL